MLRMSLFFSGGFKMLSLSYTLRKKGSEKVPGIVQRFFLEPSSSKEPF